MRARIIVLLAVLVLAGCQGATTPEVPEENREEIVVQPLEVETLRLELPKTGDMQVLLSGAGELNRLLPAALAEEKIFVQELTITFATSPLASVQAAAQGGVDVTVVSADAYAQAELLPDVILSGGAMGGTIP